MNDADDWGNVCLCLSMTVYVLRCSYHFLFINRKVTAVLVVGAVWLGVMGPWVEGTFSWFTASPDLPSLTLPDICGARVFVAENETPHEVTKAAPNGTAVSSEDGRSSSPV